MTAGIHGRLRVALALLLVAGATGCGLKGPLTMPEPSTNVVIRGPGEAAAPPGATKPAAPVKPAPRQDVDRMPPPPLPGGSTGSPRGG